MSVLIDRALLRSLGGRIRQVRGHHPMVLDDTRCMWLVESGKAALMTTRVENGLPVGVRRSLFTAAVGTPLFPVSDGRPGRAQRLIVLSLEGLTLIEAPLRRADQLLAAAGVPFYEALEQWVHRLSVFAAKDLPATVTEKFPHVGKFGLEAQMRMRVERGEVAWIQVEDGDLHALGRPELRIGKLPFYMPVGGEMWMESASDVRMRVRSVDHDVDKLELIRGLALFNSLLQKRLKLMDEADQRTEGERLDQAQEREQRIITAAVNRMASVLNPRRTMEMRETLLLSAAAEVGEVLGIDIRPPARSENMQRVKDPIEAIARASRIRYREVLLSGDWWKSDCGPLIAYRADSEDPVALLRTEKRGYEIVDPREGTRTRVDADTALELAPSAVMLYRPLPTSVTRPWHLSRFALHGRGGDILFTIGLAVLTTLIGMLTPQATAEIFNKAIPDANGRLLGQLGLALGAASFGAAMFGLAQSVISIRLGIISDATTEAAVWDRLLKLRVNFFKRFSTGDLLSRAMAVSEVNRELNGQTMRTMLTSTMSLLNLGLLYYYNSRLALMTLILGAVIALVTIISGHFIRTNYRKLLELQGSFFGLVVQLVNGVSKIRVAGAQRRAFSLWVKRYAEQLELILRAQALEDYVAVFNQSIPIISSILLFWIGAKLLGIVPSKATSPAAGAAVIKPLTVGVFLAFNTAMGTFLSGATSLSRTVLDVIDTTVKARRIRPILDAPQEVDETKVDPGVLQGEVALSHVHFRYRTDGPMILEDVSFRALPGEFVAFVGPSGGGKSTIFRLLLGFEVPDSGVVSYDGQDLLGLDMTAVRRQLGVVLQQGRISAGSILDNIAVGARVSLEEAWEAAEDAGFANDVREMPMAMHTMVSEGGTNLSGGQRQRLLIARAIVSTPSILLLDEATSALDNRTQAIVSAAMERRKVTRLVVAHRLSTIRKADRIYVLDRGAIVETGTFDELVASGGVFASMMTRQIA